MKNNRKLVPFVALALFLVAVSPAAYASTLKITLDPDNHTALINSTSVTDLVLTYPANSTLSQNLRNYSSSVTLTGTFHGDSDGAIALQSSLEHEDGDIHVQSMNVTYILHAQGNATAFVVHKETDISALVTGVFKVENGTVVANLHWKAFAVPGQMVLNLEDKDVEVNQVGSAFSMQLSGHPFVLNALFGMFGSDGLWHKATLDFSALNSPISTWTRNYDSVTNTTTYSKTISGQSSLNASASFNGQTYTLSITSDPSSQVAIHGYAVASGDSLVIQPTPLEANPIVWVAAGVGVLAAIGGAVYLLRRSRVRAPAPSIPSTIS